MGRATYGRCVKKMAKPPTPTNHHASLIRCLLLSKPGGHWGSVLPFSLSRSMKVLCTGMLFVSVAFAGRAKQDDSTAAPRHVQPQRRLCCSCPSWPSVALTPVSGCIISECRSVWSMKLITSLSTVITLHLLILGRVTLHSRAAS